MTGTVDILLLQMLNGSDSSFVDALMLTLTSGYTWIAVYVALLYLIVHNSDNMAKVMLVVGCALLCVVLSGGVSDFIVKPLVGRLRPINEPALCDIIHRVGDVGNKDFSFFSSHAANTFSLATFFALLVRKRAMSVTLFVWALTNCYTRLYLGVHYPSDVLVGMVWGTGVGLLVYWLYRRFYVANITMPEYVSTQYTSGGFTVSTVDGVILVMVFSYIYAVIRAITIS